MNNIYGSFEDNSNCIGALLNSDTEVYVTVDGQKTEETVRMETGNSGSSSLYKGFILHGEVIDIQGRASKNKKGTINQWRNIYLSDGSVVSASSFSKKMPKRVPTTYATTDEKTWADAYKLWEKAVADSRALKDGRVPFQYTETALAKMPKDFLDGVEVFDIIEVANGEGSLRYPIWVAKKRNF